MFDMQARESAVKAHVDNVNGDRRPKFGDRMRNLWAGQGNPLRDATFIRIVHNTGRTNHGTWYEMTDEKGKTWLSSPTGMIFFDLIPVSEALGDPIRPTQPSKDGDGEHG